ncbi:hypothetical protein BDV97DRAFT_208672 [Delphinella strobiligena]|nr:hypothetical protein BDV97DRAFT_208672 [Delphinella strobiligena]
MAAQQLSHNEVWDDSALVDSWNEALEEYKKYHSIAAKGESIEDAIAAAESSEPQMYESENISLGAKADWRSPEVSAAATSDTILPAWEPKNEESEVEIQEDGAETMAMNDEPRPFEQHRPMTNELSSAMPQAIMNSVQDESLKNLMMSWYYAGYYTGLYQGQQNAHAQADNQTNSKTG